MRKWKAEEQREDKEGEVVEKGKKKEKGVTEETGKTANYKNTPNIFQILKARKIQLHSKFLLYNPIV